MTETLSRFCASAEGQLPWGRPFAVFLVLALSLYSSNLAAQHHPGNLRVYVTFTDDRAPSEQIRVQLLNGSSGVQIMETYTDQRGTADFVNVPEGTYQLSVSGQSIRPTVSDFFGVDSRRGTQTAFVRVKPAAGSEASTVSKTDGNTVSASGLKVPEEASKEFDKASKLMAKQEWKKAIEGLSKAIALYPSYAEAYTNLGVIYARLGDSAKEREFLQKAISANDHFAPALGNMARLEIRERNYAAAEGDLKRATAVDPQDSQTLVLLAQVQLLQHSYDDAIASANKAHANSNGSHALAHYIAARAFEHENLAPDAAAQLETFLSEQPDGALADAVRKELTSLKGHVGALRR